MRRPHRCCACGNRIGREQPFVRGVLGNPSHHQTNVGCIDATHRKFRGPISRAFRAALNRTKPALFGMMDEEDARAKRISRMFTDD